MAHATTHSASGALDASQARSGLPDWARLGIIFGVVSAVSILLWGPIGVSGTYPRVIGAIGRALDPAWATANPYLERMGSVLKPESWLVVGLLLGGLVATLVGGRGKAAAFETVHANETSSMARYRNAFIGGLLIVFGARLAGGCTSGHIISGITQLSISSMIFAVAVFVSGIMTAKLIRKGV